MCVIVNIDLVIPAALSSEFDTMRRLSGYKEYSNAYLNAMTISADQVMNYAHRMKFRDLGRVVITFNSSDVEFYLRSNTDLFEEIKGSHGLYSVRIPNDGEMKKETSMHNLLKKLTSTINYSPRVLRTAGLL